MNQQESRLGLKLLIAIILGVVLSFVAVAAFAEQCPTLKPVVEIEVLLEVSNDVLWSIVNDGNITFDFGEEKAFLRIIPKSPRVEAWDVIDPEGNEVRVIGVFAEVFFGTSLDELELQGCKFVARREKTYSPNT